MAVSKKRDIYQDIRVLQLVRVVLFSIGAVALAVLLWGKTVPVNALYITADSLASETSAVFVPALRNLFDAPIGLIAAAALLVSAGFALHRYTKGEADYKKTIKKTSDGLKWLDFGFSWAILMAVVAMVAGVADPGVIKVAGGLVLVSAALGWLADKQNAGAKKPDFSAYSISVLSSILPWLIVAETLIYTSVFGSVRMPWFSYALAAAVLAGFVALAINQLFNFKKRQQWKQYPFVERNYLLVDIGVKVAVAAILIIGLRG